MTDLFPSEFLAARLQLRIPLRGTHSRQLNCSAAQQAVQLTLLLLSTKQSLKQLKAVLRIHDILLWIRIRIRGSMPLTNGFGFCYFRHRPSRRQLNTNKKKFFCLLLFEGTFTSFFKVKKSRNQGFYHYFSLMIEGSGSGSIPLTNRSDIGSRKIRNRIQEAQKHTDPTDPDPQH
jgi:hypothetical protein